MFLLRKPSDAEIRRFVEAQVATAFSYSEVGTSAQSIAPAGFTVDHNRILLGHGNGTWEKAVAAIRSWQMFNMPWIQLCWPGAPILPGTTIAVLVCHFGFWSLNAARIVYLVDEDAPIRRVGFAYGTLEDHAESGEERFTVEWNREDDVVSYDLFAFSRPNKMPARIGKPISRSLQKKFARESLLAMKAFVSEQS